MPFYDPCPSGGQLTSSLPALNTVGHFSETGSFLLMQSAAPTKSDLRDAQLRVAVDNSRRSVRLSMAYNASERAKEMYDAFRRVQYECVEADGLSAISDSLRQTAKLENLPQDFIQSIEWSRKGLAESIFDIFVASESSASFFVKVMSAFTRAWAFKIERYCIISSSFDRFIQSCLTFYFASFSNYRTLRQ